MSNEHRRVLLCSVLHCSLLIAHSSLQGEINQRINYHMEIATDLEALTQDYGREIFARVGRQGPFLFSPAWWDERLMQWTMGDPAIKVQLFRFIHALPLLH